MSFFFSLYSRPQQGILTALTAAACTRLWLAYQEIIRGISLADVRAELHREYGEDIKSFLRGPSDCLHFSNAAAFNDIYNNKNKWDKDYSLYRTFDMDTSAFGFVHYSDAKQRRDVLGSVFSRTSILQLQDLIQERVNVLCDALSHQFAAGKSSNIVLGLRCFTTDVVMFFCFAKTMDATKAPDFEADVAIASEAALALLTTIKYSGTLSLFFLRKMLMDQINDVLRSPGELENAPHRIIYHSLLDPDVNKGRPLPSKLSLWHEAGALLGAGSDTTSIGATTIVHHVLRIPGVQQRLVKELRVAWPVLEEVPRYEVLEKLPYLAMKEGLRMFPGGAALPRIVPREGAVISGVFIPGGTVVGQSFTWVHRSPEVFPNPDAFIPERWLGRDAKTLEASMAVFSKGPRSCLGVNLAYCELYLVIASIFRRFDLTLDPKRPGELKFREHFVPVFAGEHLHAYCAPAAD
ncbi:putative P450 monooxygenase [Multifurca ochricompacta]|uniref:P450 monooxygenase n=1 Tax=Multifurca ochricompacta TaxID=376703 RepID=A0AAD4QLP2_9AGAM|nr:putative P450 monooxygenase [Multifurca ochricompacta]